MAKKATKKPAPRKAAASVPTRKPAARKAAAPAMAKRRGDFGAPVTAYFNGLEPQQKAIALAAHRLLLRHAPRLTHSVKWGIAQYLFPGGAMSDAEGFAIYATSKGVNLAIGRGGELARKHPLLEGTGKSMRHVKLKTVAEAKSQAVEAIVKDAVRLPRHSA